MIIELKGAGFENYGAWLMLTAVVQRLERISPDIKIVMSAREAAYEDRCRLGALQKIDVRARWLDLNGYTFLLPQPVRKYLRRWGLVFECDLTAIIDIAGFGYSDQWGNDYAIRHAAAEARRLAMSDRHYIFMPQALGPFSSRRTRAAIKKNLSYAKLVAARDTTSYQNIAEITGDFAGLEVHGDFTNAVDVSLARVDKPSEPYMVVVPNANMLGSHNTSTEWPLTYKQMLSNALGAADEQGLTIVLINFGGPMDQKLIDDLHSDFPRSLVADVESDKSAKALIAGATLALSSRFHACICALSSGVPCMGTSWSHKYEALYTDYDVPDLLLSPSVEADEIRNIIIEVSPPSSDMRGLLMVRAELLKARTEKLWARVEAILNS